MSAPTRTQRQARREANQLYELSALCYRLGLAFAEGQQECDHTFKHTRAFFAGFAPHIDAEQYIHLLRGAGAACDCEVGLNICADLGV